MKLWQNGEHETEIHFYKAENQITDAAAVILPGGGYHHRADHEGRGYAEFLNKNGISAFVVDYRIAPERFPLPLLDARRAMRFVRKNAENYGTDPEKIAVMGSSAGGHLAALLCTYPNALAGEGADETDSLDYLPNAQILCYPAILPYRHEFSHDGCYINLLGEENLALAPELDIIKNVTEKTPQAFIWHTAEDTCVNVINSYEYAKALRINSVPVEMHIFPYGKHGRGIEKASPHIAQWGSLLTEWFKEIGWII